jgi:hypothetical protein
MTSKPFTLPPGKTYFEAAGYSYADIPIDREHGNKIPTSEFLIASENFVKLFRTLIPRLPKVEPALTVVLELIKGFSIVEADLNKNIGASGPLKRIYPCLGLTGCVENERATTDEAIGVRDAAGYGGQ